MQVEGHVLPILGQEITRVALIPRDDLVGEEQRHTRRMQPIAIGTTNFLLVVDELVWRVDMKDATNERVMHACVESRDCDHVGVEYPSTPWNVHLLA